MPESPYFNFTRDVMGRWAQERPDDLALWCVDESGTREQRFTFAEMALASRRAAHFFQAHGVRHGDRVLVILPRVPQWWIAMLGLIELGAVPIPGTVLLTAKDIQFRAETAEVAAVITDAEIAERADGFAGIKIVVGGEHAGWVDFDAGLREARDDFDPAPTRADDPGILYFTSGTTGAPKMVLHTQESYGRGHHMTGEQWLCGRPGDVHWNLADNGWAKAAWSSFFGPWHMGACRFHGRYARAVSTPRRRSAPSRATRSPPGARRRRRCGSSCGKTWRRTVSRTCGTA